MSQQPSPILVRVRQVSIRLEDSTSSERLEALEELQTLARQHPALVCDVSLPRLLQVLQERGSSEEYTETLYVIDSLVKCKDNLVAIKNTQALLADRDNVELLLDMLDHSDPTVGVMTSQILTEIHSHDAEKLEAMIQECPDGMNKLLQRLPDSNREAVRNQALVLVQQLTAHNEEMKKTVVFNEGFDLLFQIIASEYEAGVSADTGLVVQDCLQICCNILQEEPCQRFFFGMGSDWPLRLAYFFDPALLEASTPFDDGLSLDGPDVSLTQGHSAREWFHKQGAVTCAQLALNALSNALEPPTKTHQELLGVSLAGLIPAAAFCLARNGPKGMVLGALTLLERLVRGNEKVAKCFGEGMLKVPHPSSDTVPAHFPPPKLRLGWTVTYELEQDDGASENNNGASSSLQELTLITVPALLLERYVYDGGLWEESGGEQADSEELQTACLLCLEAYFSADTAGCDMMLQSVLAPPPPKADLGAGFQNAASSTSEDGCPLAAMLLAILISGCASSESGDATAPPSPAATVRAANVLALLFVHGGKLGRELGSAMATSHVRAALGGDEPGQSNFALSLLGGGVEESQRLLPLLLGSAARCARFGGEHYAVLVALLQTLSAAVSGSEAAARLLLEDPSNLFVLDLATEKAGRMGVPVEVQAAACLFLGACFKAIADLQDESESGQGEEGEGLQTVGLDDDADDESYSSGELTKASFLRMLDARITLTRFASVLRGGLERPKSHMCPSYRTFYREQVDAILKGIFHFHAGPAITGKSTAAAAQNGTNQGLDASGGGGLSSHSSIHTPNKGNKQEGLSSVGAPSPVTLPDELQQYILDLEAARAERDKLLAERGENDAGAERMEELALREGEELGNLRNELLTAAQQRDEYLQAVHERDAYIGELTAYQQTLLEALEKAQQARGSESESALTSSVPPSPATEAVDVSIAKLDQQLSEAQALSQFREDEATRLDELNVRLTADLASARGDVSSGEKLQGMLEADVVNLRKHLTESDTRWKEAQAEVDILTQRLFDSPAPSEANNAYAAPTGTNNPNVNGSLSPSPSKKGELELLRSRLLAAQADAAEVEGEFVAREEEMEEEASRLRVEVEALQKQLQARVSSSASSGYGSGHDKLEKELGQALAQVSEYKRALSENQEAKVAREALVVAKGQLKSAGKEKAELVLALEQANEKSNKANEQANEANDQANSLNKVNNELNEDNERLGDLLKQEQEQSKAKGQEDKALADVASRMEELALSEAEELGEVRNALQQATQELQQLREDNSSLEQELQKQDELVEAEAQMAAELKAELGNRCEIAESRALQAEGASKGQLEEMELLRAELKAAQQAQATIQQRAMTGSGVANTPVKAPATPHQGSPIGQTPVGHSAIKTPFSRSREAALLLEGSHAGINMRGSPGSGGERHKLMHIQTARLTSEVAAERRRLVLLQEQHNDLLSLLAQEEVELGVFREALGLSAGSAAVRTALLEAQRASVERYGTYVNLREDDVDVSGDQALQAEAADGELSRVDVELEESTDSHSPDSFLGGGGSHTPW